MHASCLQDILSKGLNTIGRAVPTRTTLPITQNVLIQSDGGMLKLSATNLEIAISTWVGGEINSDGEITVPARLMTEFINSLPNDRIELEASMDPHALTIKCNRHDARILGTSAEEFPPIPQVQGDLLVKLSPNDLRIAISEVAFAAATEDSRPVLTGLKVELEGNHFTFAAADGFRLAVHTGLLMEAVNEPTQFIIPSRTMSELNRFLGDQEDPVEFRIDSGRGQVLFRLKNTELVSQLIQGTFPNYSQLIPERFTTRATLPVQDLLRATRTASVFARDGAGIIRLHVQPGDPGSIQIVARADEIGENAVDMDATVEGEEAKVAFSSKYLMDVLSVLSTDKVSIEVTTPSSPGVFRPINSDSYVHVIMPMFVQW